MSGLFRISGLPVNTKFLLEKNRTASEDSQFVPNLRNSTRRLDSSLDDANPPSVGTTLLNGGSGDAAGICSFEFDSEVRRWRQLVLSLDIFTNC